MRIGVLGTGFGKFHARIYKTIPRVEIIGIAGRAEEKTRQAAEELGLKAFFEMEELISDPRVDIIDVCLPSRVHEKYAVMALNAGKHVFCETPLAYSLPEAERIMRAAEKNNKRVYVGLFNRFIAEYGYARRLTTSAELGEVRTLFCSRRTPPIWGSLAQNMILDFMLHDIDYISWLLGNPLRVASRGLPCKQGGWDNVFIDLVYEDALVVIEGSCILPMSAPFQTSLRLVCSRGALDIDWAMTGNEPETMMLLYKEQGTPETVTVPGQDPYRAECLHLFECLEHGEASPLMDVSQAYRSLKIALAAREALRRGTSSAF